ncbi:MAG: glycoside hydrolase family 38 C-terminal domain-containing protein [Polaribacter sp.]
MIHKIILKKSKTIFLCLGMFFLEVLPTLGQSTQPKTSSTYKNPKSIDLTQPTIFAIPYSHLDDQWRWAYPQVAREFIRNTLDDNFTYFKEYKDFNFNWTGGFRYAMMKEYYPKKYEELKKWIAKGRWYTNGTSWTENVVLAPSTESVIRQILMGSQFFKNEFGTESREYMLPDCFGFPYSLPSILSHCGVRGFSTQKLTWESANGIPFNIGKWIGPDGNWVIASLNAGNYAGKQHEGVVYSTDKDILKRLKDNEESSGLPIDYFYFGGGDHNNADRGGAPRKKNLESIKNSLQTDGPVNLVVAQPDLMFNAITDEQAAKFPTWEKDLLLVKHSTGVLSSQAYQKRINREAELIAPSAEKAVVTANILNGMAYPKKTLNQAWGLMLSNQFHDILPGTCIPEAHSYGWNDGIIALNQFDGVYKDAIGTLAQSLNTNVKGVPVVVYNPMSIPRKSDIEALIPQDVKNAINIAVYDAKGKEVPSQITVGFDGKKRILFQGKLAALGATVFSIRETKSKIKNSSLIVRENYLENDEFKVTIDKNGDISSIIDKSINKELLEKPMQLEFGVDFPDTKPAWRIYYKDIIKPAAHVLSDPISVKIVENGPVRVAVEVVRAFGETKVWQRIRLSSGDDGARVDVASQVDWKTRGHFLKAAFHLTAENPLATYNLDLGVIQRGNRHKKQYEVPTHSWIDLTDKSGDFGASILTGYKYGSDKVDDNTIRVTLIHCPNTKDSQQEVMDDGTMSEQRWQDWGRHQFTYGIIGHKGDWTNEKIHKTVMSAEQRPAAFVVPKYNGNKSVLSLLNINSDLVNIQAVKMAEDGSGVVVRLQELYGKGVSKLTLSAIKPIISAQLIDGAERKLGKKVIVKKGKINLSFKPFELKSILLKIPIIKTKPVLTTPIKLEFDTDVFTVNEDPEDGYREDGLGTATPRSEAYRGSFDGKGGTYPAEQVADKIQVGNVEFVMGSREYKKYNAMQCVGQKINLPAGTKVVHILAAADIEKDVVFKAGNKEIPLTIGAWTGHLGQWDTRLFEGHVAELSYSLRNPLKTIRPAYYRNHRVAWTASHHHRPGTMVDQWYQTSYMFAYRIEIPEGATSLTLPNYRYVRIMAMSVGNEKTAKALQSPFEDLHRDEEFVKKFYHSNY